jgi:hypothetical protein
VATGILVFGGAAAFAVTQLAGEHSSRSSKTASTSHRAHARAHAPLSPHSITVSVLNGTTVPGLAAQIGDRVQAEGFRLGNITNGANQQRAQSLVMYTPGSKRQAALVSRRLGVSQRQPIDAESQALGGNASVVIVVGQDKTP